MKYKVQEVRRFLEKVDDMFPVALSKKQNLDDFAKKLCEKATICAIYEAGEIVSMVAGYTENIINNKAYISIVATCLEHQGKGYGTKLVKEFIDICKQRDIEAVHLYTSSNNLQALRLYTSIGFEKWITTDETRPEDIHLIYNFKE